MPLRNLTIYCIILFFHFSSFADSDEVECDSDTVYSKPSGELCESDPATCLTDLVCYIAQEELIKSDDYVNIESADQHFNLLFWHPRYVETLIPESIYSFYTSLQNPDTAMEVLPEDTLIMKPASTPTTDEITSIDSEVEIFVMYKPNGGYCPEENQLSNGTCPTGNWLWIHGFAYDPETDEYSYRIPSSVTSAKTQKCVACHSLANRTDSIFNLFISRKYGSVAN